MSTPTPDKSARKELSEYLLRQASRPPGTISELQVLYARANKEWRTENEDLRAQLAEANNRADKAEGHLAWIEESKGSHEEYDRRQNRIKLAGMAMQGMLASATFPSLSAGDFAARCYEKADALLAALDPKEAASYIPSSTSEMVGAFKEQYLTGGKTAFQGGAA